MGMAEQHLLNDSVADVVHSEGALFRRYLRQKYNLNAEIPQLLLQTRHVLLSDGVYDLIGFLHDVLYQVFLRLRPVPGAPLRGTQIRHDLTQILKIVGILLWKFHLDPHPSRVRASPPSAGRETQPQ